jgi:hypothetical protein
MSARPAAPTRQGRPEGQRQPVGVAFGRGACAKCLQERVLGAITSDVQTTMATASIPNCLTCTVGGILPKSTARSLGRDMQRRQKEDAALYHRSPRHARGYTQAVATWRVLKRTPRLAPGSIAVLTNMALDDPALGPIRPWDDRPTADPPWLGLVGHADQRRRLRGALC